MPARAVVDLGRRPTVVAARAARAEREEGDAQREEGKRALDRSRHGGSFRGSGKGGCLSHRSALGSSASRSPSPSRLNASTVSSSAAPGKTMYHHCVSKLSEASAIIQPQLAVGGETPTPRNERDASSRIVCGSR